MYVFLLMASQSECLLKNDKKMEKTRGVFAGMERKRYLCPDYSLNAIA